MYDDVDADVVDDKAIDESNVDDEANNITEDVESSDTKTGATFGNPVSFKYISS